MYPNKKQQRLGMMILLGQHGQRQDYQVGLEHIQYAAKTCDENAPQGAYVSITLAIGFNHPKTNYVRRYMECS
jgi:hypothetical protein